MRNTWAQSKVVGGDLSLVLLSQPLALGVDGKVRMRKWRGTVYRLPVYSIASGAAPTTGSSTPLKTANLDII